MPLIDPTDNPREAGARAAANGHAVTVATEAVAKRVDSQRDPALRVRNMPPGGGQFVIPHVQTFRGLFATHSKAYRPSDEALKDSPENARAMRNDCGIMECLEARQRGTALLEWTIVPEDEKNAEHVELAGQVEHIIRRIRRFTEYRRVLLEALWFGRYGIQHRWAWQEVRGKMRVLPTPIRDNCGWLPIHGDKLVFRYDDGRPHTTPKGRPAYPHQVGILVGAQLYGNNQQIVGAEGGTWDIEPTSRGLAYFLEDWERRQITIHKHMVEDGPWDTPLDAGAIHGVGSRSRIYWDWYQKQNMLAFLSSYLERSAGGIEIWEYPAGDDAALAACQKAAKERGGPAGNAVFFPVPMGSEGMYQLRFVEPGLAGIEVIQHLLTNYFGHRIKRYILGQTLTSEADATGLGSGLAELHLDTFLQIVKYDATNEEETLTHDLVEAVKVYNFPAQKDVQLHFRIITESPNVDKKLEAAERVYNMNARLKESEVMDMVGLSLPDDDDVVLQKSQAEQAMQPQPPEIGGGQQQRPGIDPALMRDRTKHMLHGAIAGALGRSPINEG